VSRLKDFNWPGWSSLLLLLLLWEIAGRAAPGYRLYLPSIGAVMDALGELLRSGVVIAHLGVTLERFLIGYLIAAAVGASLGVAVGYFRFLRGLLGMAIELLRPMPSVAIIPVAILLLGIGDAMIIAVTVYASVWPILINTVDGVRRLDALLVDTGRTFGLSRRRILWQIVLPAASPYMVTGLRIALSIALILVTTAEMVAGSRGLGFFILDQERSMNSSHMYAGVLVVAVLGYGLNRLFVLIESRLMRWQHGMLRRGNA
jgi:ABC-type nitrate/sulfonate/bicarbonate transport system permease component